MTLKSNVLAVSWYVTISWWGSLAPYLPLQHFMCSSNIPRRYVAKHIYNHTNIYCVLWVWFTDKIYLWSQATPRSFCRQFLDAYHRNEVWMWSVTSKRHNLSLKSVSKDESRQSQQSEVRKTETEANSLSLVIKLNAYQITLKYHYNSTSTLSF